MQRETYPLLSGVVFDIGVSRIVSLLRNGGLPSLAIEFLKPHKNVKKCYSGDDWWKRSRVPPCTYYILHTNAIDQIR